MKPRLRVVHAALALSAALAMSTVSAAPTVFFDEDPGAGGMVPPNSRAVAERDIFDGVLAAGSINTETFESYTRNATSLSNLWGLGSQATLAMGGSGAGKIENMTTDPNNPGAPTGRFNTTPGNTSQNWWQSSGTFTIEFGQRISAFGFFGTDISDFLGTLQLELLDGTQVVSSLTVKNGGVNGSPTGTPAEVPTQPVSTNGSLLFYGFTDAVQQYTGVRFVITQVSGSTDIMGFDDLIIGSLPQTGGSLPEPTSFALAGLALLGAGYASRRKHSA
jgi:hypothetical protein